MFWAELLMMSLPQKGVLWQEERRDINYFVLACYIVLVWSFQNNEYNECDASYQ